MSRMSGAPYWIRTSDRQLRRLLLYPTELRARGGILARMWGVARGKDGDVVPCVAHAVGVRGRVRGGIPGLLHCVRNDGWRLDEAVTLRTNESFLVLFFKKEHAFCYLAGLISMAWVKPSTFGSITTRSFRLAQL
jgi:hypothetical protein